MMRMTHAIFQCCSMFVISSAAIAALFVTGMFGGGGSGGGVVGLGVNVTAFYVLWGISAVYFFADFVYLVLAEPSNLLVIAHHLVALSALCFMFAFTEFRIFMVLIGLQEISTFFMFLKRVEGMQKWKAELEIVFIMCWIVFRGLLSPLLVAGAVVVMVAHISVAAGIHLAFQTFFFACNLYWTVELVRSRWRRRQNSNNSPSPEMVEHAYDD